MDFCYFCIEAEKFYFNFVEPKQAAAAAVTYFEKFFREHIPLGTRSNGNSVTRKYP